MVSEKPIRSLNNGRISIRFATEEDAETLLEFIRGLAEYEKLLPEVTADAEALKNTLFKGRRVAEVIVAEYEDTPAGFALFFHNYSTFLARPGIYIEDLFVKTEMRGKGIGGGLLSFIAKLAVERDCGRVEWSALDWNEPAIRFYRNLGAKTLDEWTIFRITGVELDLLAKGCQ